ncbi:transmembrane protein ORF68 [Mizuhopecten yessoensis]|uniref:Transmembrane protein ORF68 n=1 Tax=Mizuhopecten yessoensis TaxID=6573 RepID=A0A210QYP1_MIZYE|nr:transmembrane protein ORF68 [Mizuhopecten yessoensis]
MISMTKFCDELVSKLQTQIVSQIEGVKEEVSVIAAKQLHNNNSKQQTSAQHRQRQSFEPQQQYQQSFQPQPTYQSQQQYQPQQPFQPQPSFQPHQQYQPQQPFQHQQLFQHQPQQQQFQNRRPCQGCGIFGLPPVWSFLAVMTLLILPFAACDNEPSLVQRLNYGILFDPTAKLHLGQEYWSHTFEITLPAKIHLPGSLQCRRQQCEPANVVLKTLNALRMQCMASINSTVTKIHRLIPHSYFPNTLKFGSRRSKRGLMDFIGDVSKSLFGTATSSDVDNLKQHMQAMNNDNIKLAKAMTQEAHQLTSFVSTVNERFDNVIKAVRDNHDESVTLAQQFSSAMDGMQHEYILLENRMLKQINSSAVLEKHLEHVQLAIHDFAKGKLSPFILSPQTIISTLKQVQNILSTRYPGTNIIHFDPIHYYSFANFLYARHSSNLYILLKIPISSFVQPLSLYKVYSYPVPINTTSTHATQLLDTPDYFVHTSDNQHFSVLSHTQLSQCTGQDIMYCPFHVALNSVASGSCYSSIFYNQKSQVKSFCDFRFVPNTLKTSIIELSPSTLMMYRTKMLALDCRSGQKMMKGCNFCVIRVPSRCSVTSDNLYLPPRLGPGQNDTGEITILHPVNLALIQHFFNPENHASIFGDTNYGKSIQIKIPNIDIYNHSFSQTLANDNQYHLSLERIAKKTKQGEKVFQTLSESIIDGQLAFTSSNWPDTSGIIALLATASAWLAIALFIWILRKFRRLSATLLLAQKSSALTIPPDVPSFHYSALPDLTTLPTITDHVYNSTLRGRVLRSLHIEWDQFSIINNHTKQVIYPNNTINISLFQTRRIAKLLRHPYAAYFILTHQGYFQVLS